MTTMERRPSDSLDRAIEQGFEDDAHDARLKEEEMAKIKDRMSLLGSLDLYGAESGDEGSFAFGEGVFIDKGQKLLSRASTTHGYARPIKPIITEYTIYEVDETGLKEGIWGIMLPNNKWRALWDVFVAVFVIYLSWKVPMDVCFPIDFFTSSPSKSFDYFLEGFFVIDIYLNFRTGYVHGSHIITDPAKIRHHYTHGWFPLDVIASVPFEHIFSESVFGKNQRKAVKIWKVMKLSKLLRAGRLVKYIQSYFKFRYAFMLTSVFLFGMHWFSCLWFFLETQTSSERWDEVEDGGRPVMELYLEVLDEVTLHMFQVTGIERYNASSNVMSIVVTCFGILLQSALAAILVNIIENSLSMREKFLRKMEFLNTEMKRLNISPDLKLKINRYYDYLWINKKSRVFGATSLYADPEMSHQLKFEITQELLKGQFPLRRVKILKHCSTECLAALMVRMVNNVFMPGDWVCHEGEIGKELYYCRKGNVEIICESIDLSKTDGEYPQLGPGAFFGEVALITHSRRTASIRALTCCELSVLSSEHLEEMYEEFPEFSKLMHDMAVSRLKNEFSDYTNSKHHKKGENMFKNVEALKSENYTPYPSAINRHNKNSNSGGTGTAHSNGTGKGQAQALELQQMAGGDDSETGGDFNAILPLTQQEADGKTGGSPVLGALTPIPAPPFEIEIDGKSSSSSSSSSEGKMNAPPSPRPEAGSKRVVPASSLGKPTHKAHGLGSVSVGVKPNKAYDSSMMEKLNLHAEKYHSSAGLDSISARSSNMKGYTEKRSKGQGVSEHELNALAMLKATEHAPELAFKNKKSMKNRSKNGRGSGDDGAMNAGATDAIMRVVTRLSAQNDLHFEQYTRRMQTLEDQMLKLGSKMNDVLRITRAIRSETTSVNNSRVETAASPSNISDVEETDRE